MEKWIIIFTNIIKILESIGDKFNRNHLWLIVSKILHIYKYFQLFCYLKLIFDYLNVSVCVFSNWIEPKKFQWASQTKYSTYEKTNHSS